MKRQFNKALMYQNYHSCRLPLLLGCFMFAIIAGFSMNSELETTRRLISEMGGNKVQYVNFIVLMLIWTILTMVYFSINGIKKKNVMTFLQSGPFSKEEIKINQVITLFISLALIVLTYVYVFLCITYKSHELVSLISNYYDVFVRDIIRIILCGIAFISYLVFMDLVFSNTGLEIIMIIMMPFICVFTMYFLSNIYFIINDTSIYEIKVFDFFSELINSIFNYIVYYYSYSPAGVRFSTKSVMVIIAALTILLFIISWYLNKNFKMNNVNKLFNFSFMQVIFEYLVSLEFVLIFINLTISIYGNRYHLYKRGNNLLFIIIMCVVILVSWFICKVIDKYIKKYL